MQNSRPDVLVSKLSVSYQTRGSVLHVLDNISFSVDRGTICCIVGPSGCGKSTLLRAVLGLVERDSGIVEINSTRVEGQGNGTAFVQQDCPLLPWRTALQNACLGAEIRGPLTRAIVDRVRWQMADLGLGGFENALASELSGGMRQRVAIARALESDPAILFCDEPFSAVDFVGRLALTTTFKNLCRGRGITTVFVTHNIEEAIFLGDVILVMTGRPGRIKSVHASNVSVGREDAVKCREDSAFGPLFQNIWRELGDNHG